MRASLSYGENETIRQDRKRTEEGQFKAKKTALGQRGTDKAGLGRI